MVIHLVFIPVSFLLTPLSSSFITLNRSSVNYSGLKLQKDHSIAMLLSNKLSHGTVFLLTYVTPLIIPLLRLFRTLASLIYPRIFFSFTFSFLFSLYWLTWDSFGWIFNGWLNIQYIIIMYVIAG